MHMSYDDLSDAAQDNNVLKALFDESGDSGPTEDWHIKAQGWTALQRSRTLFHFLWATKSKKLSKPKTAPADGDKCRCSSARFNGGDQSCWGPGLG